MRDFVVDILTLADVVEVMYNDVGVFSSDVLLEPVMQCRGHACATTKEIDVLRRNKKAELLNLEARLVPSARGPHDSQPAWEYLVKARRFSLLILPSRCSLAKAKPSRGKLLRARARLARYPSLLLRGSLPNPEEIKKRVAQACAATSSPHGHYRETCFCQAPVRYAHFTTATLIAISLNTLWLAIDTDDDKAAILCNTPAIVQNIDISFCVFSVFEIGAQGQVQRFLGYMVFLGRGPGGDDGLGNSGRNLAVHSRWLHGRRVNAEFSRLARVQAGRSQDLSTPTRSLKSWEKMACNAPQNKMGSYAPKKEGLLCPNQRCV